jgi:hypothetical protein
MEHSKISETMARLYEAGELEWEGYGQPTTDDVAVALAAMVDYMDGLDGPVHLELPNARLKLDRDESGTYNVWVRVGELDVNTIPRAELSDDGQGGSEESADSTS